MHNDVQQIIIDEKKIDEIVTRLANQVNAEFEGEELVVVPVLSGAMIFMADLVRKLTMPMSIECIKVSSYGSGTVSGELTMRLDVSQDFSGRNVLIVEDIIDSGNTLLFLKNLFLSRGAKSVKTCAMLDKPSRRTANMQADYVGEKIPDEFVVGYGLDYDEKYRNLPYIGILKRDIYE